MVEGTAMIVEAETDPRTSGRVAWRVTALTEHECQGQIEKLMDADGIASSEFTMPVIVCFTNDKYVGWWRSLGHTMDVIK